MDRTWIDTVLLFLNVWPLAWLQILLKRRDSHYRLYHKPSANSAL